MACFSPEWLTAESWKRKSENALKTIYNKTLSDLVKELNELRQVIQSNYRIK